MARFLFRNRWIALVWVVGVLASIGVFFSEGGGQEDLARAAESIRENSEFAEGPAEEEPADFSEEEEEPAPEESEAAASGGQKVRLVSSSRDAEAEEDDGAETYVILDRNAAVPEDGDF